MDEVDLPHYIDAQPQIFFWELDEIAPLIFFMAIGMMTGTLSAWIPAMVIFNYAFGRFKQSQMEGILMHITYWWGLLPMNRRFTNGMKREYVS